MDFSKIGDKIFKYSYKLYKKSNKIFNPSIAPESEYDFTDRQQGKDHLLIILAGYQPYFFDVIFERVIKCKAQFNNSLDICICASCCPEESKIILQDICENNNWSFLFLKKNRVTQIQNTAIFLHPKADWIFKMDEDIILCDDYFTRMKKAYLKANSELPYKVGILGPVLNINAFGTQVFLKKIGKWDSFQAKFGRFRVGGMLGTPSDHIHQNKELAEYIWEQSVPFDQVAAKVAESDEIEICPIRFSIGAILIKREFFVQNGWFPVSRLRGLGDDEIFLCNKCMEGMFGIAVATGIFVGHLGFGKQKEICRQFLEKHVNEIRL